MPIQFQFDDPEAMKAQLNEILAARAVAIRRVPLSALNQGVWELFALVQTLVPRGKTEALLKSLVPLVKKISDDVSEGSVGSPMEYARYVEFGTGIYGPKGQPITIVAKNKKALFWGGYDGRGNALIRRRVVIKGMKPRAPFARALAQFLPRYLAIIEDHLRLVA